MIAIIIIMTHDKYQLVNLTLKEEVRQCHENNYTAWGKGLDLDDYLAREQNFASLPATQDGNLTYWALKEKQDDGSWKIMCSMETLRRPALLKVKGKPVEETVCFGIGSVFTPPQNRGKGYAKIMLDQCSKRLDDWQMDGMSESEKAKTSSVLWSDVNDYYKQFDYELVDVRELQFSLKGLEGAPEWPSEVEPITTQDQITKVSGRDEAQMRLALDRDTEKDGISRMAIVPNAVAHSTTFGRAKFLGPLLSKVEPKQAPSVFGAIHNECFMLWTQDFAGGKHTAIRVFAPLSLDKHQVLESCHLLIRAALAEAAKWKFEKFSVWIQDLPEQVTIDEVLEHYNKNPVNGVSAQIYSRPDSWGMVRWHRGAHPGGIEWAYAGKYGWF